ncbi:dihydrofolate reductase [Granulimonas faecalis]|uniref:dihydrofolate reductase n=1 Tax=Granulimonas faecalis TaxID=2894155 RepID=UPI0035184FF6
MKPEFRIIVSVTDDWAIGCKGRLSASNRADMRLFKEKTWGHTVVMGRKTLETLPGGRPLPGRRNIVLTRDESFAREGVEVAHRVSQILSMVADDDLVWVIGGESVYRTFLPLCSACDVTVNHTLCPKADAWFPNLDTHPGWCLSKRCPGGETDEGVAYEYRVYRQR